MTTSKRSTERSAAAQAQELRQYGWMQSFVARYPGTSNSYALAVTTGFPA
jgi:methionine sulfoxide reductase catalytic subunit